MGLFYAYDPVFHSRGDLRLRTGSQLWNKPLDSLPAVGLCPTLDRVAAHTELLAQHGGAAALFQVQSHYL